MSQQQAGTRIQLPSGVISLGLVLMRQGLQLWLNRLKAVSESLSGWILASGKAAEFQWLGEGIWLP